MKKLVLPAILGLAFWVTTAMLQAKSNDMHCVGTCLGTYCGDQYEDIDIAIMQIDMDQDLCDTIEELLNRQL